MASRDARAAVRDHPRARLHASGAVPCAERSGIEERPGRTREVVDVGDVHRARDVAGARVDGLGRALVARRDARIDQHAAAVFEERLDPLAAEHHPRQGHELHRRLTRGADGPLFERAPGRDPGLQAAVEDLAAAVSEVLEHPPEPRRARATVVVVGDHPGVGSDADAGDGVGERRGRGQRVPPPTAACRGLGREIFVDVEVHRARDVPVAVGLEAAPTVEVPPHVDDANVGIAEVFAEPGGRNERRVALTEHAADSTGRREGVQAADDNSSVTAPQARGSLPSCERGALRAAVIHARGERG